MKQRYIKNGKTFYTPILIEKEVEVKEKQKDENGNEIEIKTLKKVKVYTNVEKEILAAGYAKYIAPKVPLTTLIYRSNDIINKKTDNKILNDFVYNGYKFYLTMENQFNFKNLYDLRFIREYPVMVKTADGFMQLDNAEHVETFYLAGVKFIETCLEEGWKQKAEAEAEIRKNY